MTKVPPKLRREKDKYGEVFYPLRYHPEQARLWSSQARFNVVPAGRRSGKTEICGKRKLVLKALKGGDWPDWRGFCAAPTRDQARRIYWTDLKKMVPKPLLLGTPSESRLIIPLINGSEIHVLGMDKPERIEGPPWDHGVLDEYANMKKQTWTQHVRPALSDRLGSCDFIGVPEGRNHYYDLYRDAQAQAIQALKKGRIPEWNAFHWISADILPITEIEAAKRDLDDLSYQQEYEACHLPDTKIILWDGRVKKVGDVVPGDILISLQDNILIPTKVVRKADTGYKQILKVYLSDGTSFRASNNHKMKIGSSKVELFKCKYLEKVPVHFKPETPQEALAGIVGFNLGDGYITRRKSGRYCAGHFSECEDSLKDLVRDFKLSGVYPKAKIRTDGTYFGVRIDDSKVVELLIDAGCIVGPKKLQDFGIPDWIKNSNLKVKRCFLAALWGADGSSPTSKNKSIRGTPLSLRSKRLVAECADILTKDFGIKTTLVEGELSNIAYPDRRKFIKDVGYLYSKKKQELAWLWPNYIAHAKQKRRQSIRLRKKGLIWGEIGDRLGLKEHTIRKIAISRSNRISNFFYTFNEWRDKYFKNGILRVEIEHSELQIRRRCLNILVNSKDHSYLLASGINNFNSFVNFSGRAYYPFLEQTHCTSKLIYKPRNDLIFCFDFNVAPGVSVVIQEQYMPSKGTGAKLWGSGIIGEVYIPQNSNTQLVCDKLIEDWGKHRGRIFCYGDATGGAGGSAKVLGSDWQLIKEKLWNHFGIERVFFKVPNNNPRERDRVNSVNSRLRNTYGEVRMMVDPEAAPYTVKDFEGASILEGSAGKLDKKKNPELTHNTDAVGYHIWEEYPVKKEYDTDVGKYWK